MAKSLKNLIAAAPAQMHKTWTTSAVDTHCLHFLAAWTGSDVPQREEALVWLTQKQDILALSKASTSTSRMIQRCITDANGDTRLYLVKPLNGSVLEMIKSPHGNYVISTCIKALRFDMVFFIAAEVKPDLLNVACSQYGCRVVEALLDSFPITSEVQLGIATELAKNAIVLADNRHGNYCLQSLLKAICDASPQHKKTLQGIRQTIFDSFLKQTPESFQSLAFKPSGSRVIQKLLPMATTVEALSFIAALAPDAPAIQKLALSRPGIFVLEQMFTSRGGVGSLETSTKILDMQTRRLCMLREDSMIEKLTKTEHGAQFLRAVGKIFPSRTLSGPDQ